MGAALELSHDLDRSPQASAGGRQHRPYRRYTVFANALPDEGGDLRTHIGTVHAWMCAARVGSRSPTKHPQWLNGVLHDKSSDPWGAPLPNPACGFVASVLVGWSLMHYNSMCWFHPGSDPMYSSPLLPAAIRSISTAATSTATSTAPPPHPLPPQQPGKATAHTASRVHRFCSPTVLETIVFGGSIVCDSQSNPRGRVDDGDGWMMGTGG